jgi:hypothetical protein
LITFSTKDGPCIEGTRMTDKQFREWEDVAFGYGYGTGEPHIIAGLRVFFGAVKADGGYSYLDIEKAMGELPAWLVINALNHSGVLNYGTSPRFGWMEGKGHELREYFAANSDERILSVLVAECDDETG